MYTHMYTLAQALILQVVVSEDAIVIAEVHSRFHIEGECPGIPPSPEFTKINPSLSPPSLPPPPHHPLPPPPLPPPLLPTLPDYFPSI